MQALWLTTPTNCQQITSVLFISLSSNDAQQSETRVYQFTANSQTSRNHSFIVALFQAPHSSGWIHSYCYEVMTVYWHKSRILWNTCLSSNWFFIQGTLCCPPDTVGAPCKATVRRVAAQLHRALSEKGLAFLVNHSIPDDKVRAGTLEDDANFRHVGCSLDLATFAHKTVLNDPLPVKIRPACQVSTRQANNI